MRTVYLILALLPAAAWAQTTKAVEGASFCGRAIDAGTFVDARARNASEEEAIVMRWLDAKGTAVHSALHAGRCVAKGRRLD